ncbi:hypothetical protein [Brumimicrobium aurantiacum]|nr:hypothetical protein [Brumimicrobium aurantiacum]
MKLAKYYTIKLATFSIASVLFLSCECRQEASGIILDKNTNEPIDSVIVRGEEGMDGEVYSAEDGSYAIDGGMTGAVKGCPDSKVSFSKEGYETMYVTNPNEKTIYLVPE